MTSKEKRWCCYYKKYCVKILRYYWLLKCISGLWDARVLTTTIADYLHTALKARSIKIMSSVQHLGLNPIVAAVLACLIGWLWVLNQESNQLTLIRWQGLKYFELLNSWANIWHHALLLSHVFIYLCFSKTLNTFFLFLLSQMLKSQTQSAEIRLVLVAIQEREDAEKTWAQEDLERPTYSLPL